MLIQVKANNQQIQVLRPLEAEFGSRAFNLHSLKLDFILTPGAECPGLLIQPSLKVSGREYDEEVTMEREVKG